MNTLKFLKNVPIVGFYRGRVSLCAFSYLEALHDWLKIGIQYTIMYSTPQLVLFAFDFEIAQISEEGELWECLGYCGNLGRPLGTWDTPRVHQKFALSCVGQNVKYVDTESQVLYESNNHFKQGNLWSLVIGTSYRLFPSNIATSNAQTHKSFQRRS